MKYLVLALFLAAQAVVVPKVTDAHKAAFYRAQLKLKVAQDELEKASQEIVKDCGEYQPTIDNAGELVCAEKKQEKK